MFYGEGILNLGNHWFKNQRKDNEFISALTRKGYIALHYLLGYLRIIKQVETFPYIREFLKGLSIRDTSFLRESFKEHTPYPLSLLRRDHKKKERILFVSPFFVSFLLGYHTFHNPLFVSDGSLFMQIKSNQILLYAGTAWELKVLLLYY